MLVRTRPLALLQPLRPLATPRVAHASSVAPVQQLHRRRPLPPQLRELPQIKSRTPLYLAAFLIAAGSWGGFLLYATHAERANSSVVRGLVFQLKASPKVKEFLGDNVKMDPMIGEWVWVGGSINMLSGKVDVQFRVKGSKTSGIASFTSVRQGKQGRFQVLRWKLTRQDGQVLDLVKEGDALQDQLL